MWKSRFIILLIFLFGHAVQAQLDSLQHLDEVFLTDSKLENFWSGFTQNRIGKSSVERNSFSLTEVLQYNSFIYFKENGAGMVSSPSFRGTNASQTAVVWNGININSQLNGQVDFNTTNTSNYEAVEIRSGGGSVQYGSGAIGGSVHLSNAMSFMKHTDHTVRMSYGSFDTKRANYGLSTGSKNWSVNLGVAYVDSENDYKYLGTDKVNKNGQYDHLSFNLNAGYIINEKHVLKLYHQSFFGDRNFSGTLLAPSKSKYEDINQRSMFEWGYFKNNYTSKLKLVHLLEEFKYFENKDSNYYSSGRVQSFIGNHNLNIKITEAIDVRTIVEFSK